MKADKPKFSLNDITKMTNLYLKLHAELLSKIEALEVIQESFPVKAAKDVSYENMMLMAANAKHKTLILLRGSIVLSGSIELDYEHFRSFVLMDKADELLRDKGFDKVTDSLRQAAVASNEELKEFAKVMVEVKSLEDTCGKLFKSFESDEVNFRKLWDKHEFKGL